MSHKLFTSFFLFLMQITGVLKGAEVLCPPPTPANSGLFGGRTVPISGAEPLPPRVLSHSVCVVQWRPFPSRPIGLLPREQAATGGRNKHLGRACLLIPGLSS